MTSLSGGPHEKMSRRFPRLSNAKVLLLLPRMLWSYARLIALFTARPKSSEGPERAQKKRRKKKKRVYVEALCLRLRCVEIRIHVFCSQVCVFACAAASRSTSSPGEFTFVCVTEAHGQTAGLPLVNDRQGRSG